MQYRGGDLLIDTFDLHVLVKSTVLYLSSGEVLLHFHAHLKLELLRVLQLRSRAS